MMKDIRANNNNFVLPAILIALSTNLIAQPPQTPYSEKQLSEIFSDAKIALVHSEVNHYRLGIFENGRTDSTCIVSYFDARVYEIYSFADSSLVWRKDSLLESYTIGIADTADTIGYLNKSSVYEDKIADIWRIIDDVPHVGLARYANGHDQEGNYLETWTGGIGADSLYKYKKAKFYPGTETKDYKVWTVSLNSWA